MWLLRDPDIRAIWREHPDRNLQSRGGSINDGDRPIAPLRPADNLKGSAVERVERIEDLDVRALRTQGIVGGGLCTRTFTVPFPWEARRQTIAGGYIRSTLSSYP